MTAYRARCCSTSLRRGRRHGVVIPFVALAMVVLLGMAGLAIDIGLVLRGAQECQQMADAGALAGHQEMPHTELAEPVARGITQTNIPDSETDLFEVDVSFYQEDEEIPEVGPAPHAGAIEVSVSKDVPCHFLCVFGYGSITVERDAVAAKVVTGTCITPMWIDISMKRCGRS